MFSIRKKKNGTFYFALLARNGQVLCASEPYSRKTSVMRGIKRLASFFITLLPDCHTKEVKEKHFDIVDETALQIPDPKRIVKKRA